MSDAFMGPDLRTVLLIESPRRPSYPTALPAARRPVIGRSQARFSWRARLAPQQGKERRFAGRRVDPFCVTAPVGWTGAVLA